MMGIGAVGAEWRGEEKSTGRVTNGRQPGCQLTVAVLHRGRVRLERERQSGGQTEGRVASSNIKILQKGDMQIILNLTYNCV